MGSEISIIAKMDLTKMKRKTQNLLESVISKLDYLNIIAKYFCGALLFISTFCIAFQIVVRFLLDKFGLNFSAPWTEEVARYVFVWVVFIGTGVISRHAGLIAVEMVPQYLTPPYGKYIKLIGIIITVIFFAVLIRIGFHYTNESIIETSPVLRISMAWVYAALPIGALLTVMNLLAISIEALFFEKEIIATDSDFVAD